jgi:spore maturation protein CgeB
VPWYAAHRDAPTVPYATVKLYHSLADLRRRFAEQVRTADAVIVGSYVPEGIAVGEWALETAEGVVAFYDIDTPVTLAKIRRAECEYLSAELISRYHLYLSFTGGPTLRRLEQEFGSPAARPLYCAVDTESYYPEARDGDRWTLGYLGTYSPDRQPSLDRLLLEPARQCANRRFVVAGPQYPADLRWPENVERIEHLPPTKHRHFYNQQKFTLNITRADMITAGYSPSVRLFEAAACGTPIISDYWSGLESFFELGKEILIVRTAEDMTLFLRQIPDEQARAIGQTARARVLSEHTSAHRARELEGFIAERSGKIRGRVVENVLV